MWLSQSQSHNKKSVTSHSITFGAIIRTRTKKKYPDNYSVTFGTTNVVVSHLASVSVTVKTIVPHINEETELF